MTFAKSRNRQGTTYDYFICIGRNSHRNGCTFRAIEAAQLERLAQEHWKTVTMNSTHVAQIRALLLEYTVIVLPSSAANRDALEGELGSVERDSLKVLEAYYADAIDVQELKTEQRRLAVRRGAIEAKSSKHKFDEGVHTRSLELCLELLPSGQQHYEQADKPARRELNQAMFEHLYVDDDEIVASDMNEALRRLISEDLSVELESERKTHQKRQIRTSGLSRFQGSMRTPTGVVRGGHGTYRRAPAGYGQRIGFGRFRPLNALVDTSHGKERTTALRGPWFQRLTVGSGDRI